MEIQIKHMSSTNQFLSRAQRSVVPYRPIQTSFEINLFRQTIGNYRKGNRLY